MWHESCYFSKWDNKDTFTLFHFNSSAKNICSKIKIKKITCLFSWRYFYMSNNRHHIVSMQCKDSQNINLCSLIAQNYVLDYDTFALSVSSSYVFRFRNALNIINNGKVWLEEINFPFWAIKQKRKKFVFCPFSSLARSIRNHAVELSWEFLVVCVWKSW